VIGYQSSITCTDSYSIYLLTSSEFSSISIASLFPLILYLAFNGMSFLSLKIDDNCTFSLLTFHSNHFSTNGLNSVRIVSHCRYNNSKLTSLFNNWLFKKLAIGFKSLAITLRFKSNASQQNTPYPENGSRTVSP